MALRFQFCLLFLAFLTERIAAGSVTGSVPASTLTAVCTQANENYAPPPPSTFIAESSGLSSALGRANVSLAILNDTSSLITLIFVETGLTSISSIGIYKAFSESNAAKPSVSFKFANSTNFTQPSNATASISTLLADAIYGKPEGFYVQVISAAFPAGAVRGQLEDNTVANGVGGVFASLSSTLDGSEVYPTPNPSTFDWATFGLFAVPKNGTNSSMILYFYLSLPGYFSGNVTSVDIYSGGTNSTGAVVVALSSAIRFVSLNTNKAFRGSVTVPKSQLLPITSSPSAYYVQLATDTLPGGASRGQLSSGTSPSPSPAPAPGPSPDQAPPVEDTPSPLSPPSPSSPSPSDPSPPSPSTGGSFCLQPALLQAALLGILSWLLLSLQ